jgi:hypothetical protein
MQDNQIDSQITAPQGMNNPSRRDFLTAAPAALVTAMLASTPAASQDLSKAAGAQKDKSATDPGPENTQIRDANPNTFLPPVTEHGEVETFWSSFSAAQRRIQEGGWSRQGTVEDFPISKDIAGVTTCGSLPEAFASYIGTTLPNGRCCWLARRVSLRLTPREEVLSKTWA